MKWVVMVLLAISSCKRNEPGVRRDEKPNTRNAPVFKDIEGYCWFPKVSGKYLAHRLVKTPCPKTLRGR